MCVNIPVRGNKIPTRWNRWFFADLIACSTCFRHHYAHHQSSRVSYRWLLPVVFGALVLKLSVWCGAEGYVSGLRGSSPQTGHITFPHINDDARSKSHQTNSNLCSQKEMGLISLVRYSTFRACWRIMCSHSSGTEDDLKEKMFGSTCCAEMACVIFYFYIVLWCEIIRCIVAEELRFCRDRTVIQRISECV